MGLFTKHDQLEKLDADAEARTQAHLKFVEESLLQVDVRYRKFVEWGTWTLGTLAVFRFASYAALGICIAADKVDHPFCLWIVGPVFVISHLGWFAANPFYENKRRRWLTRHWCDQVEERIVKERQPNQALQTTPVTRSEI